MRKFILAAALVSMILLFAVPCCAEQQIREDVSGFLKKLERTPPELVIATGSGERKFFWIPGQTVFLEENTEELEPVAFFRKYHHAGVTLLFENKKLLQVKASSF
ncbi:hypothetical protein [Aminivibrio pyruvatiphilus]|uniref:hypothetical protein n=1 Tax=Aminivibrio pyruvatiphilus TaxID=1005740 RepID=UPI00106258EC|nr:hypothetical protein [Aminivibrio pyruvatiphilus]